MWVACCEWAGLVSAECDVCSLWGLTGVCMYCVDVFGYDVFIVGVDRCVYVLCGCVWV